MARIYPQIDPRDVTVTKPSDDELEITLSPNLAGPIHSVEGVGYVLDANGTATSISEETTLAARKAANKASKESLRLARSVVSLFTIAAGAKRDAQVLALGKGVLVTGVIAAFCALYAYIALPLTSEATSLWIFVAKVPLPSFFRGRGGTKPSELIWKSYATAHSKDVAFTGPLSDSIRVNLISHRLRIQRLGEGWDAGALELDDCAVLSSATDGAVTFVANVVDVVSSTVTSISETADAECREFVDRLRNSGEPTFRHPPALHRALKKDRDRQCVLTGVKPGSLLPWCEGKTVEFKARVNLWTNAESQSKQTSTERLRSVIAAMANTVGGSIFVGVSDEGCVIGSDSIRESLRLTHFAPAMAADAITLSEMPVLETMTTDWWKTKAPVANVTVPKSKILTVIKVMKSAAPFHFTGTTTDTAPMARGAASTVPLSVTTMVDRIAADHRHRLENKRKAD